MRRRGELCAALACALASSLELEGCAAARQDGGDAPASASVEKPGYFAARGRELSRVFDFTFSIGPGIGVRAAITRHLQAGLLAIDSSPPTPHYLRPVNVTVGLRDGEVGEWSLRQVEYGLSPWYHADALERRLETDETEQRIDPSARRGNAISAQVHLGVAGVEAGFDPVEFGRFLIGLFGFGEGGFFDSP